MFFLRPIITKIPWLWVEGFTLYPFIWLKQIKVSWYRHELYHWYDQKRMGVIRWIGLYLLQWARNHWNYWNIPLEMEAYERENDIGWPEET